MNVDTRAMIVLLVPALASACAAIPAPVDPEPAAHRYRAAGNEPFWSVEVDDARLVLKTPENLEGTVIPAERIIDGDDIVFTQRSGHPAFILRLEPGPCQDSMADRTWAYTASFGHGGQILHGCGEAID